MDTKEPRRRKADGDRLVGMHLRVRPEVRDFFMDLPAPSTAMRTALNDYINRNHG